MSLKLLSISIYKVVSKKVCFTHEDFQLSSVADNSPHLYGKHIYPTKPLRKKIKHIIFQHGMIEHHGRHDALLNQLCHNYEQDFVISTLDLVGHGKSGGLRAHIDSFQTFTSDWLNFLAICKTRFYDDHDVETFVISHSLGGLIVLKTLIENQDELPFPIKKTIFCNPCIKPNLEIPDSLVSFVQDHIPKAIGQIKMPLIYSAEDLTHDKNKIIDFQKDPLISKSISLNLGVETIRACETLAGESYFYPYPSLFLISGDDKVINADKVEVFLSGMKKGLAQKKNYPNMRHDLLNETCRKEVFQDIIEYIES